MPTNDGLKGANTVGEPRLVRNMLVVSGRS